jgi:hypothetical protein
MFHTPGGHRYGKKITETLHSSADSFLPHVTGLTIAILRHGYTEKQIFALWRA